MRIPADVVETPDSENLANWEVFRADRVQAGDSNDQASAELRLCRINKILGASEVVLCEPRDGPTRHVGFD
jgi:hypothetical protein